MKLEIDVISREVVTPSSSSSPPPPHPNNYKLSFIDQLAPPILMPNALFYPANNNNNNDSVNSERSNRLKKSLSQALTLFYPLAGRLVGNSYVNCNDEGVTYVEARANNHNLFDVISNPLIVAGQHINRFVPSCDPEDGSCRDLCLVVQATFFSCGGLAIGLGISHKLADAFSLIMFVNTWAAFSRGNDRDHDIRSPVFESSIYFPPKDDSSSVREVAARPDDKKEKVITKMFVFSSQKIAHLKDKYTSNTKDDITEGPPIRPSRIEALTAFIATRFMDVHVDSTGSTPKVTRNVYGLRMAVDFRTRVVPSLSEYHFGNMVLAPVIILPLPPLPPLEKDDEDEDGVAIDIVKKIRDTIHNVNGKELSAIKNRVGKLPESEVHVMCWFSSLCGIPLNKADFGWGIPVWFKVGTTPIKNMVFFTNSLSGGGGGGSGGIDACVTLKEEDMAKFEADEELLKYVS